MRIASRAVIFILLCCIPIYITGCAGAPGPFPIHLKYRADLINAPTPRAPSVDIGLQLFENLSDEDKTLGKRETGYGAEIYVSQPDPTAHAFSKAAEKFLVDKTHTVHSVSGWDYKPETLSLVGQEFDTVISGKIRRFFCKAVKKFGRTNMILDADVDFIIGDVKKMKVITRPVKIRLERTEISFDNLKLERFMNETLADLLQTGLGQLF